MPLPRFCCKRSILALAGLALAVATNAQQPVAPSKDASKVNLLVTVRDKHGKVVTGKLSQSDFIVEEKARPQVIRELSRASDLPLTLGLVVDATLTDHKFLEQRNSYSSKFMEQLLKGDKDKGFLIQFNNREVKLLEDLTASKQKLNTAIDSLDNGPLQEEKARDRSRSEGERSPRSRETRRASGAMLYDAIFLSATEMMQKQTGRKVIVVFSDGFNRGSLVTMARSLEAAQRADMIVYAVLVPGPEEPSNERPLERRRGGMSPFPPGPLGYPFPRPGQEPGPPQPQEDRSQAKDLLQRIAAPTGGRVLEFSKKQTLDQIYQEIQEELRNQYNLGYTSEISGDATGYRKISVKTKQKDLRVQARDGYYPAGQPDLKTEKKQN